MIAAQSLVGLSALLAFGAVALLDPGEASPPAPAAKLADRLPGYGPAATSPEAVLRAAFADGRGPATAAAAKGDRPAPPPGCAGQDWPYIAEACLVGATGGPARRVARVVTIDQRRGPAASALVRLPPPPFAQR